MAALSSTQSGKWESSATWGGSTPADGDTFTINHGHKVTVNDDRRPTNGWGDITCYGNLHLESNAKFRLNGRITVRGRNSGTDHNTTASFAEGETVTGGLFSTTGSNIEFEVRGQNSDQHGIWVETERFASLKLDGDVKNSRTALNGTHDIGSTYLTVDSVTGFAEGDWITVYPNEFVDYRVMSDEGFWVHDVDTTNKRLYVRQFVSPTAVAEKGKNNLIYVDNAKVFRVGYKIIVGTGSNRNVKTITKIDHRQNILTVDSNITGTIDNKTIYQTGIEKKHPDNRTVEKKCTTLTTAITTANSTNQITVGSASDIAVGDEIIIDVTQENLTNWDYETHYTVSSKSGNTLTLNTNVRYEHLEGSLVHILTRNVTFKGVGTSPRPFLYVEYWTDYNNAHTRHIMLRNLRFTNWSGNGNSTYYRAGVMIAGYNGDYRDNDSNVKYSWQSTIQGCVIDSPSYRDSYTSLATRHGHSIRVRNNTGYNTWAAIWNWSSHYHLKQNNNYGTRMHYGGIANDAFYGESAEHSYNYMTRTDDYAYTLHHCREAKTIRHLYAINNEQRPFYIYYQADQVMFDRWHFDGYRSMPYIGTGGRCMVLDSYYGNRWFKSLDGKTNGSFESTRYLAYGSQLGEGHETRTTGGVSVSELYEFQHEYDAKAIQQSNSIKIWSTKEKAWRIISLSSSAYGPAQQVYVPANTTVRLALEMKSEGGSFTYPYLRAAKLPGNWHRGRYQTAYGTETSTKSSGDTDVKDSRLLSFLESTQFTAAMKTKWEKRTLTISPQNHGYMLVIIVYLHDNMREEVVYMKDVDIFFDNSPAITSSDSKSRKSVAVRSSFSRAKKRIGGTRL